LTKTVTSKFRISPEVESLKEKGREAGGQKSREDIF